MSDINIIQALNKALTDAMADDDTVLVLGEDIADPEGGGVAKITAGLSTRFGEMRVKSTPIAEQGIIGAAIGAAICGYRPVAEIMLMNFTTVAMDMIVNHAAKLRYMSGGQTGVPLVIRTMTGAGIAAGGQHSDYLESWFAHTAGLKVVAPSRPDDAYGLLRACIEDPDPCIFIENLLSYRVSWPAPDPSHRVPLGKAAIRREGTDITVISYSRMANECVAAADIAAASGVSCEVIDLRTISPWDQDCVLTSARKTGRVIIAHEAVKRYGVGAEIGSVITEELFDGLKKPVVRLGGAYAPVPFSRSLELAHAPDRERIASSAIELARAKRFKPACLRVPISGLGHDLRFDVRTRFSPRANVS